MHWLATGLAASLALNCVALVVTLGDISLRGDWSSAMTAFAAVALPSLVLATFVALWWASECWYRR